MILPIGDEPNPRIAPVMTYALIVANIGVFVALLPLRGKMADPGDPLLLDYLHALAGEQSYAWPAIAANVSEYDLVIFRHGYRAAAPSATSMVSSMFLHDGFIHLAGNMLILRIFGDNVEARLGRLGFVLVYLGTGIAATLFFSLFVVDSRIPLVGASGAIFGLLGCYFVWFPKNRIRLLVWLLLFLRVFEVPARWVLGVFLVVDNLLPFVLLNGDSGVAHGAHIGGFLAGAIVAQLSIVWRLRSG